VFLVLLLARYLVKLAFLLGIVVVQAALLLIIDGPNARTRHTVLFGLVVAISLLWRLHARHPA